MQAGSRLGAYEIVNSLGVGGMGEVYRARDTRLHRDVAIKILPQAFAADPDRVTRFTREAQTLAALNHPHIAQIYGVEESASARALVMELVEGETLADSIARGPLAVHDALTVGRQIADALEAAHNAGIVHRDLKPANIKIRPDGAVKVLDFGLAKAGVPSAAEATSAIGATAVVTSPAMTQAGLILGTAAYMSPEQAKGKLVDRRSDVWAFGCVLYEMLSGGRAFVGDDVAETLAEVIKSDPDWSALPDATPPSLRQLIVRCLAKDPRERFRDIGDVRLLLEDVRVEDGRAGTSSSTALWRRAVPFLATIAVTVALMSGIDGLRAPALIPSEVVRFSIPLDPESTSADALLRVRSGDTHDFVLAHDGRAILYNATFAGAGRQLVALRRFDHSTGMAINGSDGDGAPFVSPDGKWLGFVNAPDIKKVPLAGGAALTVIQSRDARTATWLETGTIVFSSNRGLVAVPDAGGEPRQVTTIDASLGETYHRWPAAVSGSVVAFVTITGDPLRTARLALVDTASGRITRSELPGTYPRPLSDHALVYAGGDGSLHIVPIDTKQLAFSGSPTTLPERVDIKSSGAAAFDVGRDGRLIFAPNATGGTDRSLVWVDRQGKEVPLTAPGRAYFYARVSPDGQRLSLDIRDESQDIWTWDTRGTLSRVTRGPQSEQYGLWTPDGQWLVYVTTQPGKQTLYRARANGIGSPELIGEIVGGYPNGVTPDGKQIIFRSEVGTRGANDLFTISLDGDRAIKPLITTEFDEFNADVSPDGRWLAFQSNLSGRMEIYVRPFPDVNAGQWTVSTGGGLKPAWAPDGRELFYISLDNKFMVVPVTTGASLAPGTPRFLFDTSHYLAQGAGRNYDVSRDGERFVMVKNAAVVGADAINVTLNWAAAVTGARTTR